MLEAYQTGLTDPVTRNICKEYFYLHKAGDILELII